MHNAAVGEAEGAERSLTASIRLERYACIAGSQRLSPPRVITIILLSGEWARISDSEPCRTGWG